MGCKQVARGFTLIELLVVVAVIGSLIAILVPSLSAARAAAYKVKCATNLRTLANCDAQYAGDNGGVVSRDSGGDRPSVFYLLAAQQKIPLVAAAANANFESQYATAYSKIKWLNCPSFPQTGRPVCFVVNAYDPRNVGAEIGYLPMKRIFRPSEVANFTEVNVNVPVDAFDVYDLWQAGHVNPNISTVVTGGSGDGRISSDRRHRGDINMSYYDGHVDSKPLKKVVLRDFTGN